MNTNIHTHEWPQIYTRMNDHKYTHAWMNTKYTRMNETHISTRMNKHTYTPLHSHPLISTIQTHIYTFTLLISTIGRFLDYPHKSTLTAQCTATLDRAIFKIHSDLRQRSTTTLSTIHPLHTHSRRHRGANCATSKLWMPDISKDLSLTRLLFSPPPAIQLSTIVQSITIFSISPMWPCYNVSWVDHFYTLSPIMGCNLLTARLMITLAHTAQLVAS